jgi:hypothetical protein
MKQTQVLATGALLATPLLTFAQSAQSVTNVTNLFTFVLNIINNVLVPIVFAVAFLMFIFGVYRYFIQGGANPEKVAEGRKFVMWSIIGFVIMFSIWGLINLFINTLGFGGASMPGIPTFNGGTGSTNTTANSSPFSSQQTTTGLQSTGGSCASNPNLCTNGNICSNSGQCVAIPANGTMGNGQSCLGNVNACKDGYTCATQSGDRCLASSNSGSSPTVLCADGTSQDVGSGINSATAACANDGGVAGVGGSQTGTTACTDGTSATNGGVCYDCGGSPDVTTNNAGNCPANTPGGSNGGGTKCGDGSVSNSGCYTCNDKYNTFSSNNCYENGGSE